MNDLCEVYKATFLPTFPPLVQGENNKRKKERKYIVENLS